MISGITTLRKDGKILRITIPTSKLIIYRIPRESALNIMLPEEIQNLPIVYVALNTNDIYIGEGDICIKRLGNINSHHILSKENFTWNELIIFASTEFSKDIIKSLEGTLIEKSKKGKFNVLNSQSSGANITDDSRMLLINQYLDMILELDEIFLNTKCFFSVEDKIEKMKKEEETIKQESNLYQKMSVDFSVKRENRQIMMSATLFKMEDGKTLLKRGAKIAEIIAPSFDGSPYFKERNDLIENGFVDENFITIKDLEFSSPSKALSILFGQHSGEKAFKSRIKYE